MYIGLKVGMMYGSRKNVVYENIDLYDVVITTFDTSIRTELYRQESPINFCDHIFHRLIIDEFHIGSSIDKNGALVKANSIWCVSGTPFTSSFDELKTTAKIIGHLYKGIRLVDFLKQLKGSPEVVTALKSVMIRHTKSQHIGGEVALSLPDATTETILLTMNDSESKIYKQAVVRNFKQLTFKPMQMEMILLQRRVVCANMDLTFRSAIPLEEKTKFSYLIEDLDALRTIEPNMHVVIMTHHVRTCGDISQVLKKRGYQVLEISSSISIKKRHENIQQFQKSVDEIEKCYRDGYSSNQKPQATVLIATMKIGNVGITLTAASRVYLFEPCLHPQMEIQAAGRIHRLGQTRPVTVKKLVFRNTVESSIMKLHDAIKDGSIELDDGVFSLAALKILLKE